FCWISATVLERMLGEAESGEIPKTLTQMYTHFLIIQTKIIREKFLKKQESDKEILLKLGKLAFQQLKKGNLIFYEEDLRECGIDVREAAVYSGVCTQIFREEFGLHESKVYCFVHLSVQEHLAALYVHLMFMMNKINVLKKNRFPEQKIKEILIAGLHKSAVDQALESHTGHLDLFLRFLLGLSLKSNWNLLQAFVTVRVTDSKSPSKEETVQYLKKKISKALPTAKSVNLFHCLNELGDHSLVEEIQGYLKSGKQNELSSSQWSALVFVLLTSVDELEEFDLTLVSVFNSETSNLKELHLIVKTLALTGSKLRDSGGNHLSAVLKNPHSKVETLGCVHAVHELLLLLLLLLLSASPIRGCHSQSSISIPPVLYNCLFQHNYLYVLPHHIHKPSPWSSFFPLSWRLHPQLHPQHSSTDIPHVPSLNMSIRFSLHDSLSLCLYRLCNCGVSDEECAALTSALRSNPSHLKELDLSYNDLRDSGVKGLSALLENPHCKLEKLWLYKCGVSDKGCAALASALRSNPSHMRELDLYYNKVGDTGVKCLSTALENPHCKLETL
ncbi:ribonuclease inhibitor-like, partial [Silurus asotus]